MYGLVNKAIKGLVIEKFGEEKWDQIALMSDFIDEDFISMGSYPDELTYSLIKNASQVLKADSSFLLEAFGEYWILYTAQEGFTELMNLTGSSMIEFLDNLDMLHSRLHNMMPHLEPPQFSTRNKTENSVELVYVSKRIGMAPMCLGIIRGLGKRFKLDSLKVKHEIVKNDENPADVFFITW